VDSLTSTNYFMPNQVICILFNLNEALTTSIPGTGDYFTHKYKGAVVTAVIGLLNGVSLTHASLLTQTVAPLGWKLWGAPALI